MAKSDIVITKSEIVSLLKKISHNGIVALNAIDDLERVTGEISYTEIHDGFTRKNIAKLTDELESTAAQAIEMVSLAQSLQTDDDIHMTNGVKRLINSYIDDLRNAADIILKDAKYDLDCSHGSLKNLIEESISCTVRLYVIALVIMGFVMQVMYIMSKKSGKEVYIPWLCKVS